MATIRLKDAPGYYDRMGKGVLEAARKGLRLAASRGLQKLVTGIIPSRSPQPVDRGVYRAGWRVEQVDEDTVAILNPEAHAVFIEYGVRAENVKVGPALIAALKEWSLRKGFASDEKEAIGMAWAIANNMKKRGIFNRRSGNGLRILEELVDKHIHKFLKEEIAREIKRVIGGVR